MCTYSLLIRSTELLFFFVVLGSRGLELYIRLQLYTALEGKVRIYRELLGKVGLMLLEIGWGVGSWVWA